MTSREGLIRDVVMLRRAHHRHPADDDLARVRADLERAVGPTVSRAASARLLGVSQTALDRWIEAGDVPAVLTPRGRREVPLHALVELIDAVEARPDRRRPLGSALRERRAAERPPSRAADPGSHRDAELRGLAYHRAVIPHLDDAAIADALVRLRRWRDDGRIHPRYADAWETLLRGPREQLVRAIAQDGDDGVALRQSSPLAGIVRSP
jgi:hypothetical protein